MRLLCLLLSSSLSAGPQAPELEEPETEYTADGIEVLGYFFGGAFSLGSGVLSATFLSMRARDYWNQGDIVRPDDWDAQGTSEQGPFVYQAPGFFAASSVGLLGSTGALMLWGAGRRAKRRIDRERWQWGLLGGALGLTVVGAASMGFRQLCLSDPESHEDEELECGSRYDLVSAVSWGLAMPALGAGAHLLGRSDDVPRLSWRISPVVGTRMSGLQVVGRF